MEIACMLNMERVGKGGNGLVGGDVVHKVEILPDSFPLQVTHGPGCMDLTCGLLNTSPEYGN